MKSRSLKILLITFILMLCIYVKIILFYVNEIEGDLNDLWNDDYVKFRFFKILIIFMINQMKILFSNRKLKNIF